MHTDTQTTQEQTDLLDTLAAHRGYLLRTLDGMTDEQAGLRPTASELCLGGIVKHVALMEEGWVNFIVEGPEAIGPADAAAYERHRAAFLVDGGSLDALVSRYEDVARRTDELVVSLPSLDVSHPLPEAPWFEAGPAGRPDAPCCTSSRRRPSTPVTPTSSARPSTAPRPWGDRADGGRRWPRPAVWRRAIRRRLERKGGDSNPRRLSPHTLSRRAH